MPRKPARKRSTRAKSPTKTPTAGKAGGLVVPEHGNGRIWQGPAANPVAGPGRPPNLLRERYRDLLQMAGVGLVQQILAGEVNETAVACPQCAASVPVPVSPIVPNLDQQLKALEAANRYGLGTTKTIHLDGPLDIAQAYNTIRETIRQHLDAEQAAILIEAIERALPE